MGPAARRHGEATTHVVRLPAERRYRVALIEDHQTLANVLSGALSTQPDIEVVGHATTGCAGLELVTVQEPDVILLDHGLPDIDGVTVASILREGHPTLRIVMLTAEHRPALIARAHLAGVDAFVVKSGALADVLAAVRGEPSDTPDIAYRAR